MQRLSVIAVVFAVLSASPLYSEDIEAVKLGSVTDIFSLEKGRRLTTVSPSWDEHPHDSSLLFIGYTPTELVVYLKNWQKEINASSRRRDAAGLAENQEDAVYLLLSPSGKGKDSYWIGVNPLGAILDKMLSTAGISEWDGDLRVQTQRTDYGWTALIVVPFSSISYVPTVWGIQLMKVIYKKGEIQLFYPTTGRNMLQEVAGLKLDFEYLEKPRPYNFFVIPSVRLEEEEGSVTLSTGGTFRFKRGENDLLDLTVKPDFSEVDVDIQEFNLERFPINYAEKRPFFVEGSSFMRSPITLIRTRNLILPSYGAKFYSVSDRSSFITHFVNDSAYQDISFSRFTYSPTKQTSLGTSLIVSQRQYNVASLDLTNYVESIKTSVQLQASKRLESASALYYISLSRREQPGFSLGLDFTSVDKEFRSPFNSRALVFDDVNQVNARASYYYNKNFYFQPSLNFSSIVSKSSSSRIFRNTAVSVTTGILPYIALVNATQLNLDFVGLPDSRVRTLSVGGGYLISSWNSLIVQYTFGDYLGGTLKRFDGEFKIPLSDFANIGLSGFTVQSPLDDLMLLQTFGEIQLWLKGLLLKPYISYTRDKLSDTKLIFLNGIILYEPKHLTGIYFAFNRQFTVNGTLIPYFRKHVFKVQIGFSI